MSKHLIIDALEMQEIMASLSSQLDIEFTNENDDYCIDLSKNIGKGSIRGVKFSHGVSVLDINFTLNKKTTILFEKQDVNQLLFLFNIDNKIIHKSSESNSESDSVNKLQHCLFSNGITITHSIIVPKDKPSNFFMVLVNRKAFEKKLASISENLPNELELILKDVNGVNSMYQKDYFSLEVAQYIEEFRQCELEEFMKPMFLEGKTYEILTYQLHHFNDGGNRKNTTLLRKSTIDKIENAVDIIKDELDVRINVHTLAKRVGLNQNTLQNGFKNLFQTSVNEYIKNFRIERAKILIENSDLNITEITYKIGINSRSYFSKLFKERYGISPSEYISQVRGNTTKSA